MKIIVITTICLLCVLPIGAQEGKPRIVISFAQNEKVDEDFRGTFTDALSEGLQNSGIYEVFDVRKEFAEVQQAEIDYQAGGRVRDDEMLDFARGKGVKYVAYITIRVLYDQYRISVKFANLETGEAVGAPFNKDSKRGGDPFSVADEIIAHLTKMRPVTAVQKKSFLPCECSINQYGRPAKSDVSAANEPPRSYPDAVQFCKEKGDGFRLPTRAELICIFSTYELEPFDRKDYWTADSRNNYEAYVINYATLAETYYSKNIKNTFRCIRE
jgi:TolB-like protein